MKINSAGHAGAAELATGNDSGTAATTNASFHRLWNHHYLRRMVLTAICLALYTPVVPVAADGPEEAPSTLAFGIESDALSRYVWHGIDCSNGAVSQTSAWVSAKSLTVFVWSNYELSSAAGSVRMNEIDLGLSYCWSWKVVSLEPTVQADLFPNQPNEATTYEASLTAGIDFGPLSPYLTLETDLKEYHSAYFAEAGIVSPWAISDRLQLETTVAAGWASAKFNDVYFGLPRRSLQLARWESSLTWHLTENVYLRPHLSVTALIDKGLRTLVEHPSFVQTGIALGAEF